MNRNKVKTKFIYFFSFSSLIFESMLKSDSSNSKASSSSSILFGLEKLNFLHVGLNSILSSQVPILF